MLLHLVFQVTATHRWGDSFRGGNGPWQRSFAPTAPMVAGGGSTRAGGVTGTENVAPWPINYHQRAPTNEV